MKESTQTLLFLGAAIASVFLAASSRPSDATFEVDGLIGTPLFNPFETEEASSLRIVRFDEETATLSDFEVAEQDGVWSLPSKGGYPADAERQMAEATTGVIDLEILAIASQSAADHAEYGVVEPSDDLEVGQEGVGTRVALEANNGEALVDVVVGKEVKDADDQRYVRKTTQDVVFVVGIDPEKFSTSFEDWIEDDLLKLSTWDIARVQLKDYSAELVMQGFRPAIAFDPRADLTVDYDDDESKWVPGKLLEYDRDAQQYNEFELAENEQLSKEQLDELKTALGDLKIVDVERKPSGLSGDLKTGDDFFQDRSSVQSLMERGFAPTKGESGETEVLSSEGEVFVTLKDGVEYVLRFGKLRLSEAGEEGSDAANEAAESDADPDDKKGNGVSRYMFVMARLNDTIIEQPELEAVPEASDDSPAEDGAEDDTEAAEEGNDEEAAEGDAEPETESRDEVIQRNQRMQDEYNAKIAKANTRVEELNDRFGDWYYVISDEVYKKVAIGRDGLIVAKELEEGEEAPGPDTSGPLGGSGASVPGLPSVPGVDFNPFATLEGETAEQQDPASETIDAVEETVVDTVEDTADAVKEAVDTAAEAVGDAAEATADAVEAAVTNE